MILTETFEQLSPGARIAAALLDLSDVSLEHEEALELVSAAGSSPTLISTEIRELSRLGIVQLFQGGQIKLHDAYRILACGGRETLPSVMVNAALESLVVMLERSLLARWTVARFGLWLRLLPETGRIDTLLDFATYEELHQVGDPQELKATLEEVIESPEFSVQDQFWVLGALAYWEYTRGSYDRIAYLVERMASLAEVGDLGARAGIELCMKQMLAAALSGDRAGVDAAYTTGAEYTHDNPSVNRILRYNKASSLFRLGAYEDVVSEVLHLVRDYYDHLGLDILEIAATDAFGIRAAGPATPDRHDDLRHVADSLKLLAMAHQQIGQPALVALLHALKFYNAASAWRSVVLTGQEVIDELLDLHDLKKSSTPRRIRSSANCEEIRAVRSIGTGSGAVRRRVGLVW